MGDVDAEGDMERSVGIIDSMTPDERRNPSKIDRPKPPPPHRRRRGVEPHEVNELVKQFDGMAAMMKRDGRHGHARPHARSAANAARRLPRSRRNRLRRQKKAAPANGSRPDEKRKLKKQREKEMRAANATKNAAAAATILGRNSNLAATHLADSSRSRVYIASLLTAILVTNLQEDLVAVKIRMKRWGESTGRSSASARSTRATRAMAA